MTANSATSGHPSPPSGRHDSCHSSTGPTSESPECIAAHRAAACMTSRAASSSTALRPARRPARRRGRLLHRAGAGPRSRSSWDQLYHRPPTVEGPRSRYPQGFRTFSESLRGRSAGAVRVGSGPSLRCGGLDKLDQRWSSRCPTLQGFRDGRCATSSTSGGGPVPARLAVVSTSSTSDTQPRAQAAARAPAATRSQPAFGPRRGCQPTPPTKRRHPCLTAPAGSDTRLSGCRRTPNRHAGCCGRSRPAVVQLVPTLRGFRDGRCATSSTSGSADSSTADRSQPAGGNPIASPPLILGRAVKPPRDRRVGTVLDSPAEGQTLGYRVADVPDGVD